MNYSTFCFRFILGSLALSTVVPQVAIADSSTVGLVGWWRFEESSGNTIADSSGNGNDGTITGSVVRVPGQMGNAVSFSTASSGGLILGGDSVTNFPTGNSARSISAWVQISDKANAGTLFSFGSNATGANSGQLSTSFGFDGRSVVFGNASGTGIQSGYTKLNDNNWHHIAGVYEGPGTNILRVYVDGQLDGFIAAAPQPNTGAKATWRIGQSIAGSGQYVGAVDEVRLYNRALSAQDVIGIITADGGKIGAMRNGITQRMRDVQCEQTPGATTRLLYGDVAECAIKAIGATNRFQFQAYAGDYVWAMVARQTDSNNVSQCMKLTDPLRATVKTICAATQGSGYEPHLYLDAQPVPLGVTGLYTIEVYSANYDKSFNYNLALKRMSPPPSYVASAPFSLNVEDRLERPWDWHYFRFNGTASDSIRITFARTKGNVRHKLDLYDPGGQLIKEVSAALNSNSGAFEPTINTDVVLDRGATGQYVLRLSADGELDTFAYSLYIGCNGICNSTQSYVPAQYCSYQFDPVLKLIPATGAPFSIGVNAASGCPFSASSDQTWLTLFSGAIGGGSSNLSLSTQTNAGKASRSGTIRLKDFPAVASTIIQYGTDPLLQVSPSSLNYSLIPYSGVSEQTLLVSISADKPAPNATYPYSATSAITDTTSSSNWLKITQSNTATQGIIKVAVDPSRLPAGPYKGKITISSPTANPPSIDIPVTMNLSPNAVPSQLTVSASPVNFGLLGGSPDQSVTRSVTNPGSDSIYYTAVVENPGNSPWLKVVADGPSASALSPSSITITASPGAYSSGTSLTGAVIVSTDSQSVRIPVNMSIGSGKAKIFLSHAGLAFTSVAGGGNPSNQTFYVLNKGAVPLNWAASATTITTAKWLKVSVPALHVTQTLPDYSPVTVSVDAKNLLEGEYYGRIDITDAYAENNPQSVTVTLNVLKQGSDPGPEHQPTGLIFVGSSGSKPQPQSITVTNVTPSPLEVNATAGLFDGSTWLSPTTSAPSAVAGSPVLVTVQADNKGLAPGVYTGGVLLRYGGSLRPVEVINIVVDANAAQNKAGARGAAACSSHDLKIQHSSLAQGFQVVIGQAITIQVKIVDACGFPLVPDKGSAASASAQFSNGDPDLKLTHISDGQWIGSWRPVNRTNDWSVNVTIQAAYLRPGSTTTAQFLTEALKGFLRPGSAPIVAQGALQNAASFQTTVPVAPGQLITVLGNNLASQQSFAQVPYPGSLGDTTIELGGVALPLLYAENGQVNAQVPYGLNSGTDYQIVVRRGEMYSVPETFTVAPSAPAIFTVNSQGTGQGSILHASNSVTADSSSPAQRGELIYILATGLGEVTPAVNAGERPSDPPPQVLNEVTVSIGGVVADKATVYASLAPNRPGTYQVQAVVPDGVPTGNSVPVVLTVGGLSSPPVTMAIQ